MDDLDRIDSLSDSDGNDFNEADFTAVEQMFLNSIPDNSSASANQPEQQSSSQPGMHLRSHKKTLQNVSNKTRAQSFRGRGRGSRRGGRVNNSSVITENETESFLNTPSTLPNAQLVDVNTALAEARAAKALYQKMSNELFQLVRQNFAASKDATSVPNVSQPISQLELNIHSTLPNGTVFQSGDNGFVLQTTAEVHEPPANKVTQSTVPITNTLTTTVPTTVTNVVPATTNTLVPMMTNTLNSTIPPGKNSLNIYSFTKNLRLPSSYRKIFDMTPGEII